MGEVLYKFQNIKRSHYIIIIWHSATVRHGSRARIMNGRKFGGSVPSCADTGQSDEGRGGKDNCDPFVPLLCLIHPHYRGGEGDHSFSAGINNAHVFMGLYIFCRMPQSKTKYNQTFKQRNKIFSSVSARALNTKPGPECCCCHFSCGVFSCWNLTFETVSELSKDGS